MSKLSRRNFLGTAATVAGAAAIGAALPGVSDAATPTQNKPAPPGQAHGDIRDIKHVVVVMQENRSFDHYFGTLKGVRGFGDRSTILLPGGKTVWEQPEDADGRGRHAVPVAAERSEDLEWTRRRRAPSSAPPTTAAPATAGPTSTAPGTAG